ncbi:hypothetical protein [Streptomyces sp. HNM1019]|uniref:hypothetical protein n=1 Tax=Streptomyces sp. HNM1019 TaxID=3424717 RepID=UPI003D77C8B4
MGAALTITLIIAVINATAAPVGPAALIGLLAVWGVAAWANNAPMNARTLRLAGPAGTEAMALNTSGLYSGIASGSAVGGTTLDRFGAGGPLAASVIIGICGIAAMVIGIVRWPTERPRNGEKAAA